MGEHTIIIPLGTGGGVVMGPQGDTNFAIVPDMDPAVLQAATGTEQPPWIAASMAPSRAEPGESSLSSFQPR